MKDPIDQGGRATLLSASAQSALDRGNTSLAQEKFGLAGSILESEGRRAESTEDRALAWFLAATQYFKGGDYPRASALARQIERRSLPRATRNHFDQFDKDLTERTAHDYARRIKKRIREGFGTGNYPAVLETLAEYPYVVPRHYLALFRAACCERMEKFRPAAIFFGDAARFEPGWPEVLARIAVVPNDLALKGEVAKAWEYVRAQLELFPNPITKAFVSVLYKHEAARTDKIEERSSLWGEQERYFREAREEFPRLSKEEQSHLAIKAVMQQGYRALVHALHSQRREAEVRQTCGEAITAAAELPDPWLLLGIMFNDDESVSVPAFRKAIELGEPTYFPRACLAYHAIRNERYEEVRSMAEEALKLGAVARPWLHSLLLQWLGIATHKSGGSLQEAASYFTSAVEIDPGSDIARRNYEHFLLEAGNGSHGFLGAATGWILRPDALSRLSDSDFDFVAHNKEVALAGADW